MSDKAALSAEELANSPAQVETENVRPLRRMFRMFSDGRSPTIDRLGVVMEVLGEMPENERRAALGYAADFYGYRVYSK